MVLANARIDLRCWALFVFCMHPTREGVDTLTPCLTPTVFPDSPRQRLLCSRPANQEDMSSNTAYRFADLRCKMLASVCFLLQASYGGRSFREFCRSHIIQCLIRNLHFINLILHLVTPIKFQTIRIMSNNFSYYVYS